MASNGAGGFSSLHDPYWTGGDYVRFAEHGSADVRLWALERLEELGLEIPDETLRRRLDDPEESVALLAAVLAGRLEVASLADALLARLERVASLADALLARLERAEDAVGAACAESLARLGDPRILDLIRRRNHLPVEDRNPRVWLALSILTGPEAAAILREAFERFPSHGRGDIASILARSLMVADPGPGISLVVERWAREAKDTLADPLLHGLLLLCGFPEGAEALRDAMENDQEPPDVSLPEEVLDGLADLLPFGPVRDIRKSCRKGKWGRAMEGLLALAAPQASCAPDNSEAALSLLLIRALAERGEAIHRVEEKLRDAVGLLLLALDQIAGAVRMAGLTLPETLDGQLRWLLSDAALPHPEAQAAVVDRLVAAAPTESWKRLCVETLERRAAQAPMAASLLGAWRSEGATPSLVGALGAGEDPELPAAAEEALVNVGEPALDAVLQALASAEDPGVLEGCLDVASASRHAGPSWRSAGVSRTCSPWFPKRSCIRWTGSAPGTSWSPCAPKSGKASCRPRIRSSSCAIFMASPIPACPPSASASGGRHPARPRAARTCPSSPRSTLTSPCNATAAAGRTPIPSRRCMWIPIPPKTTESSPSSRTASAARAAAAKTITP
ncbi:MAG: hypothetical protein HYV46_12620 [candidate division NC10 bacterium]|nr:hypothetical protein [candidate division NC10 bacterium]